MQNEIMIRFVFFAGLFAAFAVLEMILPLRAHAQKRRARWTTNLSISLIDALTLRLFALLIPLLAVGAALDAASKNWGIFNKLEWSIFLEFVIAVLILDFAIWFQHFLTHKIPILWRIHRVHHADRDMDVTTSVRFHPVEIFLSMLLKIALVYALGPSALAVICFEILLNGAAIFNHANIQLPRILDKVLRIILVTPDMHRIHHSIHQYEHDSNYGFSLSFWDRIFGTYVPQPREKHESMILGLEWQDDKPSKLKWNLLLPFIRN
ncbi:MAG: sterol desaturase family protein [Aestuariivita sp.]|nr:sterol desaturase family protein [Aestuariivita sp.]